MGFKDKLQGVAAKLHMDSHHAMERFGLTMSTFGLVGAIALSSSVVAAVNHNRELVSDTAMYTASFTTSKTTQTGKIEGVFTNELKNKALVLMKFDNPTGMPASAKDYQAFLMGSSMNFATQSVSTEGVEGEFYVFGQTGYVGVLLEADMPFEKQILNLTMRSKQDLSLSEEGPSGDSLIGDSSFKQFDQWRVFFNPGANGTKHIEAMDAAQFDPAQVYYEVALEQKEDEARLKLEQKLVEMRTNLKQIDSYTGSLATTMTPDGQYLRPPAEPESLEGDEIVGQTAAESGADKPAEGEEPSSELTPEKVDASTLELKTDDVVAGGYDFDWRSGNVYEGYLRELVPADTSIGRWMADHAAQSESNGKDASSQISAMKWILSDGTDLRADYEDSDRTVLPLRNVMNNLSQAYSAYAANKEDYQTDLRTPLLQLDMELRDVQSNSSINEGTEFMTKPAG